MTRTNPTKKYKRLGLTVVDAIKPLQFKVTAEDIDGAVCSDHEECAIAQTIKRKNKPLSVDVGNHFVFIQTKPHEVERYYLDAQSKEAVRYFDVKNRFAPCRVKLLPPPVTMQLGYRSGKNARSGPPHGKRTKPRARKTTR